MNEVGAEKQDKSEKKEKEIVKIDIHIGIFFDGTNNNANTNLLSDWAKFSYFVERNHAYENTIKYSQAQKEKGVDFEPEEEIVYRKNSNPAILSKVFKDGSEQFVGQNSAKYLHIYIEGSGASAIQAENKLIDFVVNGKPIQGLGFGLGPTGVVAKVSKAVKYSSERIEQEEVNPFTEINHIHFYLFGFSRGSACARLFSYLVARSSGDDVGILKKDEEGFIKKNAEAEFEKYLSSSKYFSDGKVRFLESYKNKMSVDFLGIYDTVSAIGFLQDENGDVNSLRNLFLINPDYWDNFHRENVDCYGLYSPNLKNVKNTCHICALDEFRANFALTDIGDAVDKRGNIELFIPGCHADIGGGYTDIDYEGEDLPKKTLSRIFDSKTTRLCVNNPTDSDPEVNKTDWEELSVETLEKLGWIVDKSKDVTSKEQDNDIEFIHYPRPRNPYSNIALKFMYERAKIKAPFLENLFAEYPQLYFPLKDEISDIYKDLAKKMLHSDGRKKYIIGGSYKSSKYQSIRQKYLHFTSSDTIHEWADFGNPPGRKVSKEYSDICRLVYHGNKGDTHVHYMQDYGI